MIKINLEKYSFFLSYIVIFFILFFGYIGLNSVGFGQGLGSSSGLGGHGYTEYTDGYGGKVRDYGGLVRVYDKNGGVLYEGVGTITEIGINIEVLDGNGNAVYNTLGYTLECETGLPGICRSGSKNCNYNGCGSCTQTVFGSAEVCDGADNDCDGLDDEGGVCGVCRPGDTNTISCGSDVGCGFGSQTRTCQGNSQWGNYGTCTSGTPSNYGDICNTNACGSPGGTIQCDGTCSGPIPSVPGEICDNIDNDCDGQIDEGYDVGNTCSTPGQIGACIGYGTKVCSSNGLSTYCNATANNPTAETCSNLGVDNNCDGSLDNIPNINTICNNGLVGACYAQGQMVCNVGGLVCNAPSIGPITEVCSDNIDNDCDGQVDEGCVCIPGESSSRSCGSNIGSCQQGLETRTCQSGGVRGPRSSCIGSIGPSTESCTNNGFDNNCDGIIDNVSGVNLFCATGVGNCFATGAMVCSPGGLYCNAANNPPSIELCDGIDNDCDGQTDEAPACYECNPGQIQSISCGYPENKGVCSMGHKDRTCQSNGQWGNYGACIGSIYPSTENCNNMGVDNNCDGMIDNIPDITNICTVGVGACTRQGNMTCTPGGLACNANAGNPISEMCGDNIDNDCDGQIDEGCVCMPGNTNTISCGSNIGECKSGTQTSVCQNNSTRSTYNSCTGSIGPSIEICDGKDNDCDGQTDEGGVCTYTSCTPGKKMIKVCGSNSNIGVCRVGYQERTCQSNSQRGDYGACISTVFPSQETCDGKDNDCDSQTDEGGVCIHTSCIPGNKSRVACGSVSNIGICKIGAQERVCTPDGKWINIGNCIGSVLPKPETCNRQDDDCDGQADEEGVCIIDNCPMNPDKLNPGLCGCGRVDYDPDGNNVCGDQRIGADPLSYTISEYIPINMPIYNPTNNYINYEPFTNQKNIKTDTSLPIIQEIIDEPVVKEIDAQPEKVKIEEIFEKKNADIEAEVGDLDVIPFLGYDDPGEYIQGELYIQGFKGDILEELFLKLDERFHIIKKEQPFLKYVDLDIRKIKFKYQKNSVIMAYISKQNEPSIDIYEPIVKYVVANKSQNYEILDTIPKPKYLKNAGLGNLSSCMEVFTKQKIAIVDNGFDINHEDLTGVIIKTMDIADNDEDVSPPSKSADRYHGTVMASIAASKASNNRGSIGSSLDTADLIVIKATSDNANGGDITAGPEGLAAAIKLRPNIINLSRGSFKDSKTLRKIVEKGIDAGITIVASAGNFNKGNLFYPSAYNGVISVGAIDESNKKASFSDYGKWITIAAPGTNINAAIFDNRYKSFDGTSEASALAAGLISYGYAHGFTLGDIMASVTPSNENVGRGYINFSGLCKKINKTTTTQKETQKVSIEENSTKESSIFETQTKEKKIAGYVLGLLGLLIIIGSAYYAYRNKIF